MGTGILFQTQLDHKAIEFETYVICLSFHGLGNSSFGSSAFLYIILTTDSAHCTDDQWFQRYTGISDVTFHDNGRVIHGAGHLSPSLKVECITLTGKGAIEVK